MHPEYIETEGLADFSYESSDSGVAAVIDEYRDFVVYLETARFEGTNASDDWTFKALQAAGKPLKNA
jgi:hypothetical protein